MIVEALLNETILLRPCDQPVWARRNAMHSDCGFALVVGLSVGKQAQSATLASLNYLIIIKFERGRELWNKR
jgi:hypothetical protein